MNDEEEFAEMFLAATRQVTNFTRPYAPVSKIAAAFTMLSWSQETVKLSPEECGYIGRILTKYLQDIDDEAKRST